MGEMCGASASMRTLFRHIVRVGRSEATVLISGESGTGKELVARALHDNSPRRIKPFIALNCSALPAELVESELFGHMRGSFTGATSDHAGLFHAAHGGTLFLDEIADLLPRTQAKVLRALENGEILRVGSTQATRVNVRVIAATNRRLEEMVETGEFRGDLFFRLKVVELSIPPLRERRSDIPLLVRHFLQMQERQDRIPRTVDPAALRALETYDWPGNVRELRNMIAGAIVMSDDEYVLRMDSFPDRLAQSTVGAENNKEKSNPDSQGTGMAAIAEAVQMLPFTEARARALEEFDRAFLTAALARNAGNIARTARSLGLHRQSLQKLMARRGIKSERATVPKAG
jgi:DNA-binding NtrC family response regulator